MRRRRAECVCVQDTRTCRAPAGGAVAGPRGPVVYAANTDCHQWQMAPNHLQRRLDRPAQPDLDVRHRHRGRLRTHPRQHTPAVSAMTAPHTHTHTHTHWHPRPHSLPEAQPDREHVRGRGSAAMGAVAPHPKASVFDGMTAEAQGKAGRGWKEECAAETGGRSAASSPLPSRPVPRWRRRRLRPRQPPRGWQTPRPPRRPPAAAAALPSCPPGRKGRARGRACTAARQPPAQQPSAAMRARGAQGFKSARALPARLSVPRRCHPPPPPPPAAAAAIGGRAGRSSAGRALPASIREGGAGGDRRQRRQASEGFH